MHPLCCRDYANMYWRFKRNIHISQMNNNMNTLELGQKRKPVDQEKKKLAAELCSIFRRLFPCAVDEDSFDCNFW